MDKKSGVSNADVPHDDDELAVPGPSSAKKICLEKEDVSKLEKHKHRKQKFRKEWFEDSILKVWIERHSGDPFKAKCRYCKDTTLVAEYSNLKTHANSQAHMKNIKAATVKQSSIASYFSKKTISTSDEVKSAEIKIAAFIAEHNLSFRCADHLTHLMKNLFPKDEIAQKLKMGRMKATFVTTNVIGKTYKEELADKLKVTKLSILTDESTDISTIKAACVVVRYFDEETKRIESSFWELYNVFGDASDNENLEGATAQGLFNGIIKSLDAFKIPHNNLIGFGADGCNVMMGSRNSVSSRLRVSFPGIVIMKCVCHSAHLCASSACREAIPRICEDLARNIYTHFKHSSKRLNALTQFQHFCNVEPHKILHPSQTRWLSLIAVVQRILEQWGPLSLYFSEAWNVNGLSATEQIFQALSDPFVKLYFLFLDFALQKFTEFNTYFQSKRVVITELHGKITLLYQDLLLTFMEPRHVYSRPLADINPSDQQHHLRDQQLYLGIKVAQYMSTTINNYLEHDAGAEMKKKEFFDNCRKFLMIGAMEVRKRYHMADTVLSKLHFLKPQNALSPRFREREGQSILPLIQLMTRVVTPSDLELMQKIDNQWRKLSQPLCRLPENIHEIQESDIFWATLLTPDPESGKSDFEELAKFSLSVLSLPHSNADCERVFSKVNLMKTKIRNRLNTDTINGTILASESVRRAETCVNFSPSRNMIAKMNLAMYSDSSKSSGSEDIADDDIDIEVVFTEDAF